MTNRALLLCLAVAAAPASVIGQESITVPVITDTGKLRGPRQPIFFRHDLHAGKDQIACLYCHSTVTVSSEPGIPAVKDCMGCHLVVTGSSESHQAEIQKVREAWFGQQPPEWVRVHSVPGFVRFPHMRHIKALGEGTPGGGAQTCVRCHGDVQQMPQVYQVETLKMGWCIRCHVQRKVSRDCTVCHY
jgi:hypothetical protein